MTVLDASALLAFLFRETGHEQVAACLTSSLISSVNVSEVLGRFERDGHDARIVLAQLHMSPIVIVDFTAQHAALAARLIPATRHLGLSLGDRACLALALERGCTAVTADQTWSQANLGIPLQIIRQ